MRDGELAVGRRRQRRARPTLFRQSRRFDRWLIGPGLAVGLVTLLAGLWLPTLSVQTFPLISDSVSILGGLGILWRDDQFFLFAVLLVFSVVFPIVKYGLGLWLWYRADCRHGSATGLIGWLDELAKWSMLDVLVVALVVAALSMSVISGVFVHLGLYLFTVSIVLSRLLLGRVHRLVARLEGR